MSPLTDERFEAIARSLRWMLAASVFVFAITIGWTYYAAYQGRVDINDQARGSCVRSLLDRADSINAEEDSALFRHDASLARRAAGDFSVAREYQRLADRAAQRARRRRARLLGARLAVLTEYNPATGLPSAPARKEAERVCGIVNPKPGAWPWSRT